MLPVAIVPPAVPTTTLPVTFAAVLVPLVVVATVPVTTVPAVAFVPAGSPSYSVRQRHHRHRHRAGVGRVGVRRGARHALAVFVPSVALVALLMLTTVVSVASPAGRLPSCLTLLPVVALRPCPLPPRSRRSARRAPRPIRCYVRRLAPRCTTTIHEARRRRARRRPVLAIHLAQALCLVRHHQVAVLTLLFRRVVRRVVVVDVTVAVVSTGTVKVRSVGSRPRAPASVSSCCPSRWCQSPSGRAHHHAASHRRRAGAQLLL